MVVLGGWAFSYERGTPVWQADARRAAKKEARDEFEAAKQVFFIDNILVRIHFIIEMILVDRPRAMAV